MRTIRLQLLLSIVAFMLAGCGDLNNKNSQKQELVNLNFVQSILVKQKNDDVLTITDTKIIKQFAEAIQTAEYDHAQLDIAAPEYTAVLQTKDGASEAFSFWLKKENVGLFIKSGQSGYYKLPAIAQTALLSMFQQEGEQRMDASLNMMDNIKKITLATSISHGAINPEVIAEFTDPQTIQVFLKAIVTAEPIEGILNTTTPIFDIVLLADKNDFPFHLWISETTEQAMIMDMKETHTGYTISEKSTAALKRIIYEEAMEDNL